MEKSKVPDGIQNNSHKDANCGQTAMHNKTIISKMGEKMQKSTK